MSAMAIFRQLTKEPGATIDDDDEIRRLAAVDPVVGGCTTRAPRRDSCLGLETTTRTRLLLGCRRVCVPVPVLLHFCAVTATRIENWLGPRSTSAMGMFRQSSD